MVAASRHRSTKQIHTSDRLIVHNRPSRAGWNRLARISVRALWFRPWSSRGLAIATATTGRLGRRRGRTLPVLQSRSATQAATTGGSLLAAATPCPIGRAATGGQRRLQSQRDRDAGSEHDSPWNACSHLMPPLNWPNGPHQNPDRSDIRQGYLSIGDRGNGPTSSWIRLSIYPGTICLFILYRDCLARQRIHRWCGATTEERDESVGDTATCRWDGM